MDKIQSDLLGFQRSEGQNRQIVLTGDIDDPYQGPFGDFVEHEAGSGFSFKPIEIRIFESPSIITDSLEESDQDNTIGSMSTKANLEFKEEITDYESYTPPPVNVYLDLPRNVFKELQRQLLRCQFEDRVLRLELDFRVSEAQTRPETDDFYRRYGLRLADIEVSKSQEFKVFNIRTSVAAEQYRPKSKRLSSRMSVEEKRSTDVSVTIEQSRAKMNFRHGSFEILQFEGKNHTLSAHIDLQEIDTRADETRNHGTFEFSPREDNSEAVLYLSLNYYVDDFDKFILPVILSGTTQQIVLRLILEGELDYTEKQSGVVYSFSFDFWKDHLPKEVAGFEDGLKKIETHLNTTQKMVGELKKSDYDNSNVASSRDILDTISRQLGSILIGLAELEKQKTMPNDIISRLLFKIPLVGSVIKYLLK